MLQHLLEKQREEFRNRFTPDWWMGFGTTKDIDKEGIGGIESFLSTIQQEILQATKTKIEEIFKNADEREDRVELSDITSWLEGDTKN